MDILGVGLPELIVIALILLTVAGPKRTVRWSYILGREIGKLRSAWREAQAVMRSEVEAAGLDKELHDVKRLREELSEFVIPFPDVDMKDPMLDTAALECACTDTPGPEQ